MRKGGILVCIGTKTIPFPDMVSLPGQAVQVRERVL